MILRSNQLRWIILSTVIIGIDLGSKYFASFSLPYAKHVEILPFFNLILLHNYGAAFSFLSDSESFWQVMLLSIIGIIVAIVIVVRLAKLSNNKNPTACGLSLILGGALGNIYDRVIHGYVIDFLDLHINNHHWPIFNIADSAICIGVTILIVISFRSQK